MSHHLSQSAIPTEPRGHGLRARVRARLTLPLLALLAFVLIAPLVPYAAMYAERGNVPNPGTALWNEVRQRTGPIDADTQVRGVESNVLINQVGERWREFRSKMLVPAGAWLLLGTLAFLALFRILRGTIPLEGGRSGQLVPRFSVNQRVVHWFAAILFVFLAVTGLVLLYGRFVLIPLLGPEGFSATAAAAKEGHNLFGPIFPFAVLAMLVLFARGNGFRWIDVKWFFKAGGLLKGHPASSGYYNGGQKSWFWMVVLFGIAISVSGLILDFGVFGQGREVMALAHVVHGGVAVVFIAASLGHIYIGTIGMEGAFESMSHGYVDANWAREHHDLWLAEMEAAGMVGVEPNALEEVKRHDNIDFKGFGSPGTKAAEG
jgi:formate dehydrogenase subunit gamma